MIFLKAVFSAKVARQAATAENNLKQAILRVRKIKTAETPKNNNITTP